MLGGIKMLLDRFPLKNRWENIPYPNTNITSIGETPNAGNWPLYYFKRVHNGGFTTLSGKPIAFSIKTPEESDGFNTYQLQEVIDIAKKLTDDQKEIATYWGFGVPQNKFVPIIQCLINTYSVPACSATRLYSILDTALNDSMVICWYYKYTYQIPRPVQYNPKFVPHLKTPQHPSYPSGHSVSAGCVYEILSHFFPKESAKLEKLCNECSISRLYAGIHYTLDLNEGFKLGTEIAKIILDQISSSSDQYGSSPNIIYNNFKDAKLIPPPYKNLSYCGGENC